MISLSQTISMRSLVSWNSVEALFTYREYGSFSLPDFDILPMRKFHD